MTSSPPRCHAPSSPPPPPRPSKCWSTWARWGCGRQWGQDSPCGCRRLHHITGSSSTALQRPRGRSWTGMQAAGARGSSRLECKRGWKASSADCVAVPARSAPPPAAHPGRLTTGARRWVRCQMGATSRCAPPGSSRVPRCCCHAAAKADVPCWARMQASDQLAPTHHATHRSPRHATVPHALACAVHPIPPLATHALTSATMPLTPPGGASASWSWRRTACAATGATPTRQRLTWAGAHGCAKSGHSLDCLTAAQALITRWLQLQPVSGLRSN